MRLYLAGWQASRRARELEVIHKGGLRNRCFSFANLVKIGKFPYHIAGFEGSYQACIENKVGIMADSGVVSYRSYRAKLEKLGKDTSVIPSPEEFVELYVEWVKKNKHLWDFYVTVDMEPRASNVLKWLIRVEKMGIRPMPVFHGDTDIDWLNRYVDRGYKYIGIGGSYLARSSRPRLLRQYLDGVFNFGAKHGVKFHGLGATTPWVMLTYPWKSVDSSWWSRSAGYGSIMDWNPVTCRMSILHISPRVSKAPGQRFKQNALSMEALRKHVEAQGFDFETLRNDFTARHIYNCKALYALCDTATKRHKSGFAALV